MDHRGVIAGAVVVAAASALIAAGCGDGSSNANEPAGSVSFLKPKGKNKIATFGEEASDEEREAASEVLEESFQAREDGEWKVQCETLTKGAIVKVEENAALQGASGSCASNLKLQAEPLAETKAIRANTMTGEIDALRVKDDKGYALYHGAKGKDYAMPMEKVNDEWKVDALVTQTP